MLQIRRILFPTDFSECAENAFGHAAFMAERFGAELHVLHALVHRRPEPVAPGFDFVLTDDDVAEQLHAATSRRIDLESLHAPVPVIRTELHATSAAAAILDYAQGHDVDLVIMGTHGRTGMDRLFLGSVAEEVVRHAPCPVFTLTARRETPPTGAIRRILVPVDFSPSTDLVLTYARELARTYGAAIDLLHIVEDALLPQVYGIEPVLLSVPEMHHREETDLNELMRLSAALSEPDLPVTCHVTGGAAGDDIVRFAERYHADLIVIATHGRTGLARLLMGSVTEKVIRSAPCPVFTIKTFGKHLTASAHTGRTEMA